MICYPIKLQFFLVLVAIQPESLYTIFVIILYMFNFNYKSIDFAHKLDNSTTPSENFERHMHYFNEVIFFVSGDVDYHVESESRKLSPGDVIIVPSGKFHFAVCNLNQPYERYVLKFPDKILPGFLVDFIKNCSSFYSDMMKYHLDFSTLDDFYSQFKSEEEIYALFIGGLIKFLIYLSKEGQESFTTTRQNDIIKRVIDYIDKHLNENITLESLCEHFYFSKSYLSNCFKKYMNTPIMQYVRSKKIIIAHRMIMNGMKKTLVAEQLGFENYSTFYRDYRKIIGLSKKEQVKK